MKIKLPEKWVVVNIEKEIRPTVLPYGYYTINKLTLLSSVIDYHNYYELTIKITTPYVVGQLNSFRELSYQDTIELDVTPSDTTNYKQEAYNLNEQ